MADSKEIIRVFRSYNKEKGWPMAHEAADLIETLEARNAVLEAHLDTIYQVMSGMPFDADECFGAPRP